MAGYAPPDPAEALIDSSVPAPVLGQPPRAEPRTGSVAAIVVTHDGAGHVRACLQALIEGGTAVSDITVVDNASTDDTVERVRSGFPRLRLIESGSNLGYARAINLAAESLDVDYVAVLNQDLVAAPGMVALLVRALASDPAAGLATPRIRLRSDPARLNAAGNDVHYTGFTSCRAYLRPAADVQTTHEVPAISGAAFVIRGSLLRRLRGLDPLFFLYLEDADLSLRAALLGARTLCVPEAVASHDFEPRFSAAKIHWLERNRYLLWLRLFRLRTLVVMAPALWLAELLVLGYALMRGPRVLAAKLGSWRWLVGHAGEIARSRRRIQRDRIVPDRELLTRLSGVLVVDELPGVAPRLVAAIVNPVFRWWWRVVRAAAR